MYEYYPPPKSDVTAEEVLMRFVERAPIILYRDKEVALRWAVKELGIIQGPEQLKLFEEERC